MRDDDFDAAMEAEGRLKQRVASLERQAKALREGLIALADDLDQHDGELPPYDIAQRIQAALKRL